MEVYRNRDWNSDIRFFKEVVESLPKTIETTPVETSNAKSAPSESRKALEEKLKTKLDGFKKRRELTTETQAEGQESEAKPAKRQRSKKKDKTHKKTQPISKETQLKKQKTSIKPKPKKQMKPKPGKPSSQKGKKSGKVSKK